MQALMTSKASSAHRNPQPTVVCLHSSASSSRQWNGLRDRVGDYEVIAPELVGYGESRWRRERAHSMHREVRAVERLLDRCDRPVHLVGHSFGGAVALMTALSRPQKIRSLVVYEPVLFPLLFASGKPSAREIWLLQTDIRRMVRQGELERAAEYFVDYWNAPGAFAGLNPPTRENIVASIPKVASEFGALISAPVGEAELRPLAVPTLLLSGSRSPGATRDIVELLSGMLPRRTAIRLDGMGHMGPVTHPDRVNGIIHGFINQHESTGMESTTGPAIRPDSRIPPRAA